MTVFSSIFRLYTVIIVTFLPAQVEEREGEPFVLDRHTLLVGPADNPALRRLHVELSDLLGAPLSVHTDARFRIRSVLLNHCSYMIRFLGYFTAKLN